MTQKAFSIEINRANKTMDMMVSGTFTPQDYDNFVKDYAAKTGSIDAKEYTLVVDCKTMNLLGPSDVEGLSASFVRYKESGFQKVVFIITQAQTLIKMQLGRVARGAGLSNVEVVVE
ncbi:hypothetical protein Q5741_00925 [Paenibacillus sp. JX-17]|uniref:STAS domain-containing protein n=1 Tax=Paenibacillus lacisoli TaxID=3064525 RepID=A0ABT9C6S7_9BACL|nr:hypothetical protein [Paenibacillus sp. JX-17]MDO7904972.1 hypothetical protein [Paenibacillus sp. JX-17]